MGDLSLVAIIRHVGSRLNPSGEIVQSGAPGREFAESANTKASHFMRAGVSSTGPVPYNEGFDRPLGTCKIARVVFLVEGLRSLGVIAMDFPGAFVDGLNGVRVGDREISGEVAWPKRLDVANGLSLTEPRWREMPDTT